MNRAGHAADAARAQILQAALVERMPPEIGAAYGRLGNSTMARDAAGVRTVRAEDFVLDAPSDTVVGREDVIAVMEQDLPELSRLPQAHHLCRREAGDHGGDGL